ncbi:MAG: tRNA 2-selenouridine(34) synthase MnmH [Pseudomonadota bacterium]|jgi:tRNA 2-selenouridine synthase
MAITATVAQLAQFDDIIDVRSPSEFREDHIPGALNFPVLDDEERARIGTLYKQSPFEAKKAGAALVARNIARHIEQHFAAKPKNWRPLIYCWRGGKRSGSMAHILAEIGWAAAQLEGGYKAYRRLVLEELQILPNRFDWRVICGPTGSGKSRLLQALDSLGAQVLDLEELAAHRGSILGNLPDTPQPSQKTFESRVWSKLHGFVPQQPVYVEAESKKIGQVRVPDALLAAMWSGRCIRLEPDPALRVGLLKEEYRHFLEAPEGLAKKLDFLAGLHGRELVGKWQSMAQNGQWDQLVAELLERHYDPAYGKSTLKHYPNHADGLLVRPADLSSGAMLELARWLMTPAAGASGAPLDAAGKSASL